MFDNTSKVLYYSLNIATWLQITTWQFISLIALKDLDQYVPGGLFPLSVLWERFSKLVTITIYVRCFFHIHILLPCANQCFVFIFLAELEITFLKQFCRASNLLALMEDDRLPEDLGPYSSRLQALFKPPSRKPRRPSNSRLSPLSDNLLNLLVNYLNGTKKEECIWLRPDNWASLTKDVSLAYAPVPARGQFSKRVEHTNGFISTFTDNPDNSCVYFKNPDGTDMFGRVFSIFSHSRAPVQGQHITDVWIHVQCFPPLPSTHYNPFNSADQVDLQCALRMWSPTQDKLIKIDEVIAQCTWIMYKAGEMNSSVDVPTIGIIIQKR